MLEFLARIGDEAEFELRRGAEDFLQLFGVLQARHFDKDAIVALALDVGLGGAQRIDAAAQNLDRLVDGAPNAVVDRRVGDENLDRAAAHVVDFERLR